MGILEKDMLSAATGGDLATVEKLVKQGADINYRDTYDNFAMFTAAWEGNLEALDLFYSLGATISYDDINLLCNAAYNGKSGSVKWLLEKGENANFSFSATGENALHYTISKTSEMDERVEIVKMLLTAGIDVNKKTIAGVSTLCFMRDAFLKAETPLHRAAAFANVAIIDMLLKAGAQPDMKDANGDTPLSWGSWYLRDSDILRLLLYPGVSGIG